MLTTHATKATSASTASKMDIGTPSAHSPTANAKKPYTVWYCMITEGFTAHANLGKEPGPTTPYVCIEPKDGEKSQMSPSVMLPLESKGCPFDFQTCTTISPKMRWPLTLP